MSILKEVLRHEVNLALGCTEPAAVALACSAAYRAAVAEEVLACEKRRTFCHAEIYSIEVDIDPGTLKNGTGVCVGNAMGEKGNAIAAALGAICGNHSLGLEVLRNVDAECLRQAKCMVENRLVKVVCVESWKGLRIEVKVDSIHGQGVAVIEGVHTNISSVKRNGKDFILEGRFAAEERSSGGADYVEALSLMTITDLIREIRMMDTDDRSYIKRGIDVNLSVSEAGLKSGHFGSRLKKMVDEGLAGDDIFSSTKIMTSSATDARMSGINMAVMSSGGSGNQGIVAILCPYNVGAKMGVSEDVIVESIALSHLLNAYVKCFSGKLAPTCGCAIAAGVGAAAAIAYQQADGDAKVISMAINNILADISGILCDGAKSGCALKVITSTDSAIRAALFALQGRGIDANDGIVGHSAEETIRNLGKVSTEGMANVDDVVLRIMSSKTASCSM